ncbi:MAG: hypothetical protein LBQ47_06730 [Endomicrobium sp.]|jgi:hypothetical protein|nr:hypothetical protein [Endomicrobium sp.]
MSIKKILILILCFLFFIKEAAFASAGGTTVFEFLKIPSTASHAALAGMPGFSSDSASSSPAMLGFVESPSFAATYAAYFQDVSFQAASFAFPYKNLIFNLSYSGFNYGNIDGYSSDPSGNYVFTGTFGADDSSFGIGVGYNVTQWLSVGAGLKYARQNIDASSISGFALNASAVYLPDANWYAVGGFENVGPNVEGYSMPASVYAGGYSYYEQYNILYGGEIKVYSGNLVFLKVAGEYDFKEILFFRLGYNISLTNSNDTLGEWYQRNLTAGFGISYGFFSLDYAWLPFGDLGSTSMVTLQISF